MEGNKVAIVQIEKSSSGGFGSNHWQRTRTRSRNRETTITRFGCDLGIHINWEVLKKSEGYSPDETRVDDDDGLNC
ncbi:hypothetical protein NDU88_009936 [Pleurodeles waltl]|uniref:Uncharacterized protein n=1 Tax=Pleurodeles waltl TaxID=8319 RepID=A0AAV7QYZ1_PLEWA|nr:hypothetical protein NDU88_009936 [Pleurodeles waltl]